MAQPTETTALAPVAEPSAGGTFEVYSEGLSSAEAARRLLVDGPNVLDAAVTESFISILLTQMRNVIFLLTTCAATISYIMGDEVKARVLMCIVFCVCLFNALGEYSGQDPGKALREQMDAEAVTAFRSGVEVLVEVKDLVIGDVVRICMGQMVPADMLVLHAVDLQTNEAVLTGEPTEQVKTVEPKKDNRAFSSNMLYSGTSVVAGEGKAEVVATGMNTQVGLIAKRLKGKAEQELNPLQKSINFLGSVIGVFCMIVILVATALSYATGYQNPQAPCPDDDDFCLLMTSASRGLIMAVSIIPHGLPFVVMVMLRVGSREMAVRHAMVTRRTSVDYLGATSVICTDKTGTLTQGKMTAQVLVGFCRDGQGPAEEVHAEFYPLAGLSPNGGIFEASKLSAQAKRTMDQRFDMKEKRQVFAEADLPDLAAQEPGDLATLMCQAHLACGFLNCYATKLQRNADGGQWVTKGNMTEAAVKVAAAKGGFWDDEGRGFRMVLETHLRVPEVEVPFTSKRKMMATVHALPEDRTLASLQFEQDATHCAILKGAPDRLISKLSAVLARGTDDRLVVPGGQLSDKEREALEVRNTDLASKALRSLLVAVCPLSAAEFERLRGTEAAEERLELLLAAPGLCFMSMWGIFDPPRPAVRESVRECHRAGIRVVMVTGDQRATATAIGKQVDIIEEGMDPEACSAWCRDLQEMSRPVHFVRANSGRLSTHACQLLETSPNKEWKRERTPAEDSSSTKVDKDALRISKQFSVLEGGASDKQPHEPKYRPAEELAELTSKVTVWARAQPADKVALVESLIYQGHITAMTGDGVNDAPALKRADAGVAMGISGTGVAKNASDLILMDDDFSTIVAAIREGRRIYSNTQKYVTFNLSVKAGECFCLMSAIVFGVPVPIRGLQLLFNLLVTHIMPPLSLAWEKPEPYLMKVPPRETKGDLVVSRVMWLFRWLPFVMCFPIVVMSCLALGVWTNTGFVRANSLIGSSKVGALEEGSVACAIAGVLDAKNNFLEDARPFHCLCHVRESGNPFAAAKEVDQWGRTEEDALLAAAFDKWTGSTGNIYHKENTPWSDGVGTLLKPCVDANGVERWCWQQKFPGGHPWLPESQDCASYGARLGQSMSYVVIHLGEILTLLSYRTDGFFVAHMCSNPVYTGLFIVNVGCLLTFLYAPPVAMLLGLAPLGPTRFGLAVSFAVFLLVWNELVKILYRNRMAAHNELMGKVALERGLGDSPLSGKGSL